MKKLFDSIKKVETAEYHFAGCLVTINSIGEVTVRNKEGIIATFDKNQSNLLIETFHDIWSKRISQNFAHTASGY